MNRLNKIHNQLINYAYNRTLEAYKSVNDIQNCILRDQPSSAVNNKFLNYGAYNKLQEIGKQLEDIQALSADLFRISEGLDPIDILLKEKL